MRYQTKAMIKRTTKLLPKVCAHRPRWRKKIVAEYQIPIHKGSALRVRVIVFDSRKSMGEFFVLQLKRPGSICPATRAVCTDMSWERKAEDGTVLETLYDKTLVALICFVRGEIDFNVIAHEAVHAAHSFAERTNLQWHDQERQPQEAIAYPTGILTQLISQKLYEEGLL